MTGKNIDGRRRKADPRERGGDAGDRPARKSEQEAHVTIEAGSAKMRFTSASELVPHRLDSIGRIGPFNAAKLATAKIIDSDDLLRCCGDPTARAVIADMTGFSPERLREWAGFVELLGIDGITPVYAELLRASGVLSVANLTARTAAGLADAMMVVNAAERITELVPSEAVIDGWMRHAARLEPRVVE